VISIIVPVYNTEKYLKQAITSVLDQTYPDWQLILINDGSTDSSLSICETFAAKDDRIKVFSQENKGQAAARNLGLEKVNTPYVTFLDSDDALSPDTLEKNMRLLQDNPEVECLQYPIYLSYGSDRQAIRKGKPELITDEFYLNWLQHKKISWIVCDKVFKAALLKGMRFKEGIVFEDNLFVSELLLRLKNILISEEGLYYYYLRADSTMTSQLSGKKEEDSLYVTYQIFKRLKEQSLKGLSVKFLLRVLNIKKSLRVNFNVRSKVLPRKEVVFIGLKDIMASPLSLKSKIKLLLYRFGGIE